MVNFFPVPDGDAPDPSKTDCDMFPNPKDVCTCERHEACAVHVLGCKDGCTGDSAGKLLSFLGCYVAGEKGEDECAPKNFDSCVKSAGLDSAGMTSCAGNKATSKDVQNAAYEASLKTPQPVNYSFLDFRVLLSLPSYFPRWPIVPPHVLLLLFLAQDVPLLDDRRQGMPPGRDRGGHQEGPLQRRREGRMLSAKPSSLIVAIRYRVFAYAQHAITRTHI